MEGVQSGINALLLIAYDLLFVANRAQSRVRSFRYPPLLGNQFFLSIDALAGGFG